ncbi:uncharacterized protein BDZ99DRAFT_513651 [Mytilinidion resinicola]|uniref:Uncharacterized protein n=1 Tax=Mytilinidion resinicola TaxID=574789 RepID=A0A6A6ZB14_9PEZI|nr:uncharacterized protein BDZ99DRAFT_513651 [Mytilinidion resinicola]KAF2817407.1 hypothetical protein BDZ99DRAFT_513651 [Mytilinidion resinicola]
MAALTVTACVCSYPWLRGRWFRTGEDPASRKSIAKQWIRGGPAAVCDQAQDISPSQTPARRAESRSVWAASHRGLVGSPFVPALGKVQHGGHGASAASKRLAPSQFTSYAALKPALAVGDDEPAVAQVGEVKETNFALLGSPGGILASPTGACVHQTGLSIRQASVRDGHDLAVAGIHGPRGFVRFQREIEFVLPLRTRSLSRATARKAVHAAGPAKAQHQQHAPGANRRLRARSGRDMWLPAAITGEAPPPPSTTIHHPPPHLVPHAAQPAVSRASRALERPAPLGGCPSGPPATCQPAGIRPTPDLSQPQAHRAQQPRFGVAATLRLAPDDPDGSFCLVSVPSRVGRHVVQGQTLASGHQQQQLAIFAPEGRPREAEQNSGHEPGKSWGLWNDDIRRGSRQSCLVESWAALCKALQWSSGDMDTAGGVVGETSGRQRRALVLPLHAPAFWEKMQSTKRANHTGRSEFQITVVGPTSAPPRGDPFAWPCALSIEGVRIGTRALPPWAEMPLLSMLGARPLQSRPGSRRGPGMPVLFCCRRQSRPTAVCANNLTRYRLLRRGLAAPAGHRSLSTRWFVGTPSLLSAPWGLIRAPWPQRSGACHGDQNLRSVPKQVFARRLIARPLPCWIRVTPALNVAGWPRVIASRRPSSPHRAARRSPDARAQEGDMAAAVRAFPRSCQSSSLHASIKVECSAGWHAHQRVSDVSQRRFHVPRNDPRCHQVRGGSSTPAPLGPGCWTGQGAAVQGEPHHHAQRRATGGHGLAERVSEHRVALQLLAMAIAAAVPRYQADPAEPIPRDMHHPGAHPSPDDLVTDIQAGCRPKRRGHQIQLVARSPPPFPICVSPTPPGSPRPPASRSVPAPQAITPPDALALPVHHRALLPRCQYILSETHGPSRSPLAFAAVLPVQPLNASTTLASLTPSLHHSSCPVVHLSLTKVCRRHFLLAVLFPKHSPPSCNGGTHNIETFVPSIVFVRVVLFTVVDAGIRAWTWMLAQITRHNQS